MNTVTVSLGTFVDRALAGLESAYELGRRTVLQDTINSAATTFNISDATLVQATGLLEFGNELMYVTAKSGDLAASDLTVVRGYAGTTAAAHTTGDVGAINPPWPRQHVADQIVAAFPFMEGNRLPLVAASAELTPERDPHDDNIWILEVPATVRGVSKVRVGHKDVNGWEYVDDLPVNGVTYDYDTGKIVRLPAWSDAYYPECSPENLVFSVVYSASYSWSADPPTEASTITVGEGSTEVPVKYAIWQLVEARERRRGQVDRSTEHRDGIGIDVGPQHVRLARESFFSTLDIARRINRAPLTRPFVSNSTFSEVY